MVTLTPTEREIVSNPATPQGMRMAMEIVCDAADMLGADRLIPITSSHIDGCLYHGDSGVLFNEKLAEDGLQVAVPTTTNVGALNLLKPDQIRVDADRRKMAFRLMEAHSRMGCRPTWTCAPYQAEARPGLGDQIAWGESNAVAFANTVLGARTNRYGDFLDIACALTGRAPYYGLHKDAARRARVILDMTKIDKRLLSEDAFFPVLGALIGRLAGDCVPLISPWIAPRPSEDQLKALCAGAAATGSTALIHIEGVTPEAPNATVAQQHNPADESIFISQEMIIKTRDSLTLATRDAVDCVALGSPHFSAAECRKLLRLISGRKLAVPFFVCVGRHVLEALARDGSDQALLALGVEFVADTCVVVTPILPKGGGAMMTNSAKFAHYAQGNTGYAPVFGSLSECVESAIAGRLVRDAALWR